MIQFVEMECPNCGGNLEKIDENTAKCSHCGAEFLIDKGQPERVTNIYQAQKPQQSNHTLAAFLTGGAVLAVILFITITSTTHTNSNNTDT